MIADNGPLFPCWARVSQMGHHTVVGYVTVTTELGAPMLRVDVPGADGDDDHEPLPAGSVLVAPASLYGVEPLSEAAAHEERRASRPRTWRPQAALPGPTIEEAEEVEDDGHDLPY